MADRRKTCFAFPEKGLSTRIGSASDSIFCSGCNCVKYNLLRYILMSGNISQIEEIEENDFHKRHFWENFGLWMSILCEIGGYCHGDCVILAILFLVIAPTIHINWKRFQSTTSLSTGERRFSKVILLGRGLREFSREGNRVVASSNILIGSVCIH